FFFTSLTVPDGVRTLARSHALQRSCQLPVPPERVRNGSYFRLKSGHDGGSCSICRQQSQYAPNRLGRTTDDDALVGFDQRALDQDRVDGHRGQDRRVIRARQGLGLRFGLAQTIARRESALGVEPGQFLRRGGRLQIFDDRHIGACILKQG